MSSTSGMIVYLVFIIAIFYFMAIRPQSKEKKKQAELIKEISGVNPLKCMKCGKCSASCPSFYEMDIKPHQFVSYVANENIEELVNSNSLWKCLSCLACVERCPRDVKPGKLIDAARQLVVRQKGQN